MLGAALDERPARLALEVKDVKVALPPEELTEVVISMTANLDQRGTHARRRDRLRHEDRAFGEGAFGEFPRGAFIRIDLRAQRREARRRLSPHPRGRRLQVGESQCLGSEVGIVGSARQREVHFGRALAEHGGRSERRPHGLEHVGGSGDVAQLVEVSGRCSDPFESVPFAADLFIITTEQAEGPLPPLALVRHQLLQDRQRGGIGPRLAILQRSERLRGPGEGGLLGQEPANLIVGVDPRFQAPKNLEEEAVAEDERRIALFHRAAADRPGIDRRIERRDRLGGDASQPAGLSFQVASVPHQVEQPVAENVVGRGVVEDARASRILHAGDECRWGLLGDVGRLLAAHRSEQKRVDVITSLAVVGADAHEERRVRLRPECDPIANAQGLQGPRFGPEPALRGDVRGEDLPLHDGPVLPLHQRFPAAGQLQEGQRVGCRLANGRDRGRPIRCMFGNLNPLSSRFEMEPNEPRRPHGQEIRRVADGRELNLAEQLHGSPALERRQIKLDRLHEARQVRDAEDGFVFILSDVDENLAVPRREELDRPPAERLELLPQRDEAAHPVEERRRLALLGLDVDRLIAEHRVDDGRRVEPVEVGAGETGVAVAGPLHRGPHAVAVAQIDVVAHADLVAVIDHRRAGH